MSRLADAKVGKGRYARELRNGRLRLDHQTMQTPAPAVLVRRQPSPT
jgi:hypothetical protein